MSFQKHLQMIAMRKYLEEGFDVIQTILSYFETRGFTAKEIAAGFEKHNEKLENRGWDRRAVWEVKEVE